jgi:hypothetical protein
VVGALLASSAAWAAEQRVAVDLSTLDETTYEAIEALALQKRLVLRLVQDGFAVVALSEEPDIVVTLRGKGDTIVLAARRGQREQRRRIERGTASTTELHLEITQKTVALVQELAALAPTRAEGPRGPPPEPESPSGVAPDGRGGAAATVPEADAAADWGVFEPSLGADVLLRSGGVDPMVRLAGRLALSSAVGLHLLVGLSPSLHEQIDVLEWHLLTGGSYRFTLLPSLRLELAALVGLLIHDATVQGADPGSSADARLDFSGSLPITLAFRPIDRLSIHLRAAPGLTGRAREHILGSSPIWQRGVVRLEAGGGLALHF